MTVAKNVMAFLILFCAIGILFLFQFYGYLSIEKPFQNVVPAIKYMTSFRNNTLGQNNAIQKTNAPKYVVINNEAQNPQLRDLSSKIFVQRTTSGHAATRRTTSTASGITTPKTTISPENKPQISSSGGYKSVLWENRPNWLPRYLQDDTTFSNCEVKSCKIETNKEKADAVIIYMVGYQRLSPFYRPPGQIWILYGLESPKHIYSNVWKLPAWKEQINWTMTYRLDSTIPIPYGQVFHRPVNERPDLNQVMAKKKKLIAWVVSNCVFVESGRKEYVDLLNKHLREPVDIYGNCGTLKADADVFKKISEEYKFYLGLENSLCYDYITEKFHERQNLNLIVIGRGWGNYSFSYPEKSYINTKDFKSTKELADYIHYLDKNDEEYLKYLRNKAQYIAKDRFYTMRQGMCEICKRLHQPPKPTHYSDIGNWWFHNTCISPTDLI